MQILFIFCETTLPVDVNTDSATFCWTFLPTDINEPQHEISNNVVCATRKASDQSAYTLSLIRAFVSRLIIL